MLLVYLIIAVNIASFALYGIDKHLAVTGKRRLSEASLIAWAAVFGAAGALLGMLVWRHKIRKRKFTVTVPVLLGVQILLALLCLYMNYHLTVTEYDVDLGLQEEITIVQISDLHNQWFGKDESRLLDRIEDCEPDIIAVTGDVVDSNHTSYSRAVAFFEGAVKIAPVYYVTGNHEAWLAGDRFDRFLDDIRALGVVVLDDTFVDCGEFILAGIGDASLEGFDAYEAFEEEVNVIMLAHEPGYFDLYCSLGADLVLAGHIHGGQIRLPGVGGVISPDEGFNPDYCCGIYESGVTTMIVSRGLGNSVLPLRINNFPEIVVVHVR